MRTGQPLPLPLTLSILRQVCDQLDNALNMRDAAGQQLWIMHRDIAPAHILITEAGLVRLVASGTPHGTPGYLPPEYVTAGMFDPRGDVFALGAVAHEMLANRPLFWGADLNDTLARITGLAIAPPSAINPQVPAEVDGIVLMALGRDPQFRWQSIGMMRDGLNAVMERLGMFPAARQPEPVAEPATKAPPPGHIPVELLETSPAAPQPPIADPLPQPQPSDQWCLDTDHETQIAKVPASVPELPVVRMTPTPTPTPAPPARPSPPPSAPAFDALPDLPAPRAFVRPGTPFPVKSDGPLEIEFPEATQIGAIPLIQMGRDTGAQPIVSLVGEPQLRAKPSSTILPPPVAMVSSVANPDDKDTASRTKLFLVLGLGVVVTVVTLVLLDVF